MIKRVRADIADLQLNRITEIQPMKNKVGIAKHLCGTATGALRLACAQFVSLHAQILAAHERYVCNQRCRLSQIWRYAA